MFWSIFLLISYQSCFIWAIYSFVKENLKFCNKVSFKSIIFLKYINFEQWAHVFLFYEDQGKTKTDIMRVYLKANFDSLMRNAMLTQCLRLIIFPGRSVTLAVIVTDHLAMHFSLPLPISALSCPLPAFTAGCHLHIPASLLISSFSWLGDPLIPQVPGRVNLDWDAYSMKGLAWQRASQGSHELSKS